MGLLARIVPIVDGLDTAKEAVSETLRQVTYTHDREEVVKQLRTAASSADQAASKARELAKAMESGFGTLPEEPDAPAGTPEALQGGDDDDGA